MASTSWTRCSWRACASCKNISRTFASSPSWTAEPQVILCMRRLQGCTNVRSEETPVAATSNNKAIEDVGVPLQWLAIRDAQFSTTTKLACKYFPVQATSVSSEYISSPAGNIVIVKRNRYSCEKLTKLAFLYERGNTGCVNSNKIQEIPYLHEATGLCVP